MDRPPSPDRRSIDTSGVDLSDREVEILQLVTHGWTNQEIVDELGVSANALRTQLPATYLKIGVPGRIQAVIWGAHHGLVAELQPTVR